MFCSYEGGSYLNEYGNTASSLPSTYKCSHQLTASRKCKTKQKRDIAQIYFQSVDIDNQPLQEFFCLHYAKCFQSYQLKLNFSLFISDSTIHQYDGIFNKHGKFQPLYL